VVSRLALRWAAQQPPNLTGVFPRQTAAALLGLLRSPTQGKPAHHGGKAARWSAPVTVGEPDTVGLPITASAPDTVTYLSQRPVGDAVAIKFVMLSRLVVVNRFVVVSGLALRWAAQQPPNLTGVFPRQTAAVLLGLLRSPTQGKPAHHGGKAARWSTPVTAGEPDTGGLPITASAPDTVTYLLQRAVGGGDKHGVMAIKFVMLSRLVVVSRLALRWAAQQPPHLTGVFPRQTAAALLGLLRSPTQGKPAHHGGEAARVGAPVTGGGSARWSTPARVGKSHPASRA
jgi:CRISPR/Cas system endoribonuclease Cas6 (RAMP superfamily)